MTTWIALLRAINLGSHNRVPMAELRAGLTALGFEDVRTLIASGNIVLRSELGEDDVAAAVSELVAHRFEVETPTVVRSAAELDDVIARNPMREAAQSEPKLFYISFLSGVPADERIAELTSGDRGGERVAFSGREIFSHHPEGLQRAGRASDAKLGVVATARNWNTVTRLAALANASS